MKLKQKKSTLKELNPTKRNSECNSDTFNGIDENGNVINSIMNETYTTFHFPLKSRGWFQHIYLKYQKQISTTKDRGIGQDILR